MRISGFSFGEPKQAPLENHDDIARLDLDPFTVDQLARKGRDMSADDQDGALRQLRRQLLEEILPHTIRPIRGLRLADVYRKIHEGERPLHALCLSGGGIRSASFALGVLQALSRERWLSRFDYISTVSGGGYIGGWLSAWILHDGAEDATRGLSLKSAEQILEPEAAPIRHLRTYANYLSPQLGILSADTWTLVATYLRNLLLNWIVLVPMLAAALLIPWVAVANVSASRATFWDAVEEPLARIVWGLGILTGTLAVGYWHLNRPDSTGRRDVSAIPRIDRTQSAFLLWCLLPLILTVAFFSTALVWSIKWQLLSPDQLRWYAVVTGAGIHTLGFIAGSLASHWTWKPHVWRKILLTVVEALVVIIAGAVAGFLAYEAVASAHTLDDARLYVLLAAPVFMLLIMFATFVFTGWLSRFADDLEREWSARYAAWILIPVAAWIVVAGLALFGPKLLLEIPYAKVVSAILAAITGGAVAGFGTSAATDAERPGPSAKATGLLKSIPVSLLLGAGAVIFTALLVVGLATVGLFLIQQLTCLEGKVCPQLHIMVPHPIDTVFVMLALLGFGLLMARLIDTNHFSLHAMYRARLIRTFLGASRRGGERRPDPFTGFDEKDDVAINSLALNRPLQRPFHVVNMALNLVGGTNLAWRNRKARSFTVSPLFAGSAGLGYRPVSPTNGTVHRVYGGGERGITLGTAMTISGAAASPNMGYHSSPLITFLMTFFNLRLGWWLGNPGPAGNDTFHRAQPALAVRPIIDELFGRTDDRNKYVYLSDGGHFENLGLYEMVLRRCGRIVVVDASCDPEGAFGDLANAMRLVAVDLGVPIRFPQGGFNIYARGSTANSGPNQKLAYWAEGEIDYSAVDQPLNGRGAGKKGKIYYVKPTLYGKEPQDVFSYGQSSRNFPHESTADQFFSESQLESYRALGEYIGVEFMSEVMKGQENLQNDRLP